MTRAVLTLCVACLTLPLQAQQRTNAWNVEAIRRQKALFVLDTAHRETSGTLESVDSNGVSIRVGQRIDSFARPTVLRISRPGDSIDNGAMIGATLGGIAALLAARVPCRGGATCDKVSAGQVMGVVAIYAGIGVLLDAMVSG